MGVRQLGSYALKVAGKKVKFSSLGGKVVAIDTSIFMYNWLKRAAHCRIKRQIERGDQGDHPSNHWEWHCIRDLDSLRKNRIQAVFMFESDHPDEKEATVSSRRVRRATARDHSESWEDLSL